MQSLWEWEKIDSFGSLRERDCFVAWMRGQIADGMAEEMGAAACAGERWFGHILTGSLWRLIPDENPYGPGFWPAPLHEWQRNHQCDGQGAASNGKANE